MAQNSDEKVESGELDLASLILAADSQLETLHRQTRETRSSSPDYKLKLEATLEQVFVLAKSLVADVGHQAVQLLTELKALKDQNGLLADQVLNVEGKVDSLVLKATAEPRPEQPLHPDMVKSLSSLAKSVAELKHQVDGLAKQQPGVHPDLIKSLAHLKQRVESLAQPQPQPDPPAHPDLAKSLLELKGKVDDLIAQASTKLQPQPDPPAHPDLVQSLSELKSQVDGLTQLQPDQPDLVKSLSELNSKVDGLAEQQPHPDLVKSLAELKSTVDGLVVKVSAEPQPPPDQPVHPDWVKSLSELKLCGETVVLQLTKLKDQQSQTNQSLSLQMAILKANLTEKLDKVEQALKDSKDSDRLDECIRETVGSKPVFLQWLSWIHNLWYKEVPKHSSLWHPQASKGLA